MIFPHQGIISLNYTPFEVSRCYESHCPIDSLRGGGPCPRSPSKPAQEMGCALEVRLQSLPRTITLGQQRGGRALPAGEAGARGACSRPWLPCCGTELALEGRHALHCTPGGAPTRGTPCGEGGHLCLPSVLRPGVTPLGVRVAPGGVLRPGGWRGCGQVAPRGDTRHLSGRPEAASPEG